MKNSQQQTALNLWHCLPHASIWLAWLVMCVVFSYGSLWFSIVPALPLIVALLLAWESPPPSMPFSLIGAGLLYDMLSGQPIGLTSLLWYTTFWWHRRKLHHTDADEPFAARWLRVSAMLAIYLLLEIGIAWFLKINIPPFSYLCIRLIFMVLFIPPLAWLMFNVRQKIYRRLWVFLPPEVKPL